MSEFAQNKGESAAAWVERLARVSTAGLSGYVLSVLGSWRRDASEMAGAAKPAPAARPADPAPAAGKADDGPAAAARPAGAGPLDEAKRAARALSPRDLSQFTFWLTHGRLN